MFAKDNFDIFLEQCYWDHAIELILGFEPKSTKIYLFSITNFIQTITLGIINLF